MPKYGIHHIVMSKCVEQFKLNGQRGDQLAADIARLLSENEPAANLGSIGPDIFFWGPDYDLAKIFNTLYKNIEKIIKTYEDIMRPIEEIKEKIGEPFEEILDIIIPSQTKRDIKLCIDKINEAEKAYDNVKKYAIFDGVLEGVDLATQATGLGSAIQKLFNIFVPDRQYNRPELGWYWFDMLHYRRSGAFAKNLLNRANTLETKAYAYGYLSHIATDLIGHGFVNQLSGSSYRINPWRHVTIENYLDSWKFYHHYGLSINKSLLSKLSLPPNELPTEIRDQLKNAFYDTYADTLHPIRLRENGFYSDDDLEKTYENFYVVLKQMEAFYVAPPEEPFSNAMDILVDALEGAIPTPPPLPPNTSHSGGTCTWTDIFSNTRHSSECQDAFYENIQKWIDYGVSLLDWTSKTLRAIIDMILVVYLYVPVNVLLALLYGFQLLCYISYRALRLILSVNGLLVPEPDELDWAISEKLTTLTKACGRKYYPSRGMPESNNLICPVTDIEPIITYPSFYQTAFSSNADSFIGVGDQNFYADIFKKYANSETPSETRDIQNEKIHFGNAIPLTYWMISSAYKGENQDLVFANLDLDGDRGYGYRTWHGFMTKSMDVDDFTVYSEQFVDECIGNNCFDFFQSKVPSASSPSLINAYLLSLVCQFNYPNELFVESKLAESNRMEYERNYQIKFKALFNMWGFNNPEQFKFHNKSGALFDTEVVIMPCLDRSDPYLIIAFRGSETPFDPQSAIPDWLLTDLNAIPVPVSEDIQWQGALVHGGFWDAFKSVSAKILETVKPIQAKTDCKIWVTGNSLGGALANICGIWLQLNGCHIEGIYTFAAPRCGNEEFAELYRNHLNGKCHRWVNGRDEGQDIVTNLPPVLHVGLPVYAHVGEEHRLNETAPHYFRAIFPTTPENIRAHFTQGYSRGIYRQIINVIPNVAMKIPLPSA